MFVFVVSVVQVCFGRDGRFKEHLIKRTSTISTSGSTNSGFHHRLTPRNSSITSIKLLHPTSNEEDDDDDDDDADENDQDDDAVSAAKPAKQSWLNVRAAMAYYNSLRKIKRS